MSLLSNKSVTVHNAQNKISFFYSFLQKKAAEFKSSQYWRDVAWLTSGNLIVQLITLLTIPLLSRLYTPSDFGMANLFQRLVGLFAVIFTLRFEMLVQLPKEENDSKKLAWLVIILSATFTLISIPFFSLFATELSTLTNSAALAPWVILIPISAGILSVSEALNSLCHRQTLFKDSSKAIIKSKISIVLFQLIGIFAIPPAGALVASSVFGGAIQIFSLTRGNVKIRVRTNYEELKQLVRHYFSNSGSLAISHILIGITFTLPTIYIAKTFGESKLGQFATAYQLVFLPSSLLGAAIGNVYFQRAAFQINNCQPILDLWNSTFRKSLAIGIPIFLIVGIASPSVLPIILGAAWEDTGKIAMIITPAAFFSFVSGPTDRTCILAGAKLYSLFWHLARAMSTLLVIKISKTFNLGFFQFLSLLSIQMAILYAVDLLCERRFATKLQTRILN